MIYYLIMPCVASLMAFDGKLWYVTIKYYDDCKNPELMGLMIVSILMCIYYWYLTDLTRYIHRPRCVATVLTTYSSWFGPCPLMCYGWILILLTMNRNALFKLFIVFLCIINVSPWRLYSRYDVSLFESSKYVTCFVFTIFFHIGSDTLWLLVCDNGLLFDVPVSFWSL